MSQSSLVIMAAPSAFDMNLQCLCLPVCLMGSENDVLLLQNCGFRPNWKSIIYMASTDGKTASSTTSLTLEALTTLWRRMESLNFHDEASQFVYIMTRFEIITVTIFPNTSLITI